MLHPSGGNGLQAHRVNERIVHLARHHYRDTATLLERAVRAGGAEPVIIGGHQDTIPQFLGLLPAGLRDQFAGCFIADPHTLTRRRSVTSPIASSGTGGTCRTSA